MATPDRRDDESPHFDTTQWSLVLEAADRNAEESRAALAALCRTYWYPLYAYARSRMNDAHHAEDVTQDFFARLLERNLIAHADRDRGRFRSFLLTSFKNFLSNEWDKNRAMKRGGGRTVLSLDFAAADSRYQLDASRGLSPEQMFEKQWTLRLLDQVLERLREEYGEAGEDDFVILKDFIAGIPVDRGYSEAARLLGKSENATRAAVHRLRRKYRRMLREEIARTLGEPADVDSEIQSLFSTLR